MNAMVVGADKLGNIPDMLTKFGIRITQHVSGRHMAHQRKIPGLPKNTDLYDIVYRFFGAQRDAEFSQSGARAGRAGSGVPPFRELPGAMRRALSCE